MGSGCSAARCIDCVGSIGDTGKTDQYRQHRQRQDRQQRQQRQHWQARLREAAKGCERLREAARGCERLREAARGAAARGGAGEGTTTITRARMRFREWRTGLVALMVMALLAACEAETGAGEERVGRPDQAASGVEVQVGGEAGEWSAGNPPSFEDAPAPGSWDGIPAAVNLDSHPEARQFRTVLTQGAAEGPNFAGHYTVVAWGCGTLCQRFMIVDARDGEVYQGRTTSLGVEHRLDSQLLVVNPSGRTGPDECPPAACTPQYLLWDGERLTAAVDTTEAEAIRRAARDYVRRETQIQEVEVEIEAVSEGWARLRVSPAEAETDPATLYLRRAGDRWIGVAIGTAFAPEDLDTLGVPQAVRNDF
jgi:hypothetical protein